MEARKKMVSTCLVGLAALLAGGCDKGLPGNEIVGELRDEEFGALQTAVFYQYDSDYKGSFYCVFLSDYPVTCEELEELARTGENPEYEPMNVLVGELKTCFFQVIESDGSEFTYEGTSRAGAYAVEPDVENVQSGDLVSGGVVHMSNRESMTAYSSSVELRDWAEGGTITVDHWEPDREVSGRFQMVFFSGEDELSGTFRASWCPGANEGYVLP